jgi:hypothetical protein
VYPHLQEKGKKMPEAKNVNYSDELTVSVLTAYAVACAVEGANDETRAEALEAISAETGKTVKSLRQKLVREKVYIAKTYTKKTGGKVETKETIVAGIARAIGVTTDQVGGLEKATKPALVLIRKTLEIARAALDAQDAEEVES